MYNNISKQISIGGIQIQKGGDNYKQYSVSKLGKSRKTYSDQNAIILNLNFLTAIEKQKKNRMITKCQYIKYRNKLTRKQISGISKKDSVQISYDKWPEEVPNYFFQAESKKGYHAIKKAEENTECSISKRRKCI